MPVSAAIVFFGSASNPTDNGSLTDAAPQAAVPPTNMLQGDLVYLVTLIRSTSETLSIAETGGQSWTAETQQIVGGSGSFRVFHARFNGTWSANPSVETPGKFGTAMTVVMLVFRPSSPTNTWSVDVAQAGGTFSAPAASPFDVTATGRTAAAASTVTIGAFATLDDNTWALQTTGWTSPSAITQFRNTAGNDHSLSIGYKIQTVAGATGNLTNQQTANGGDAGRWAMITFAEAGGAGDSQAPTAPGNFTATAASSGQINLSWAASTDNVAVTGYLVERCQGASCTNFAQIGTPGGASFSNMGLLASTTYRYRVRAQDAVPNYSAYSSIVNATTQAGGPGPVGHWKLDEGSGTSPQDGSGNANHCSMSPAPVWASGRVNDALTFDGVDDIVNCGSGSTLDSLSALTVGAWINLASMGEGGFGRIVAKGDATATTSGWRFLTQGTNQFELSVDHATTDVGRISAVNAIPLNTWTHVLATWGGSTDPTDVKLYVNGTEVSSYTWTSTGAGARNDDSTTSLRIGNNSSGGGTTHGKIDEVRLFNRVLSAAEIQALADSTAPTSPAGLSPTPASSSVINLSWTASTDNVAVTEYRIERCQGASCTNFSEIDTALGPNFADSGLAASTTYRYRVRASDANANLSGYSSIAAAATQSGGGGSDTQAPSVPSGLTATAASSAQINLSWTASTDNVAVTGYLVERCEGAMCSNFSQIATPVGTIHNDVGLAESTTYRYRVRARDAIPNFSAYSSTANGTTLSAPPGPTGLIVTASSSTEIDLAWSALVGATGYLLERCQGASCASFALISSPTATYHSDLARTPSTSYSYRVRAQLPSGLSGYSNIVTQMTPASSPDCN